MVPRLGILTSTPVFSVLLFIEFFALYGPTSSSSRYGHGSLNEVDGIYMKVVDQLAAMTSEKLVSRRTPFF